MKQTITLISDWRLRDPYVAFFKSALLSKIPESNILDISHHIERNNLEQTAFLMKQSYLQFPENSLHLLLTNVSFGSRFDPVVVTFNQHIFIGQDNGIFTMMFGSNTKMVGRKYKNADNLTAIEKIIQLSEASINGTLEEITEPYLNFQLALNSNPKATISENTRTITGTIVYIDAYFNAITNIPTEMFLSACKGKNFKGTIASKNYWPIQEYNDEYVSSPKFYFTPGALGCLEITHYLGKIAILLDLSIGDTIEINY